MLGGQAIVLPLSRFAPPFSDNLRDPQLPLRCGGADQRPNHCAADEENRAYDDSAKVTLITRFAGGAWTGREDDAEGYNARYGADQGAGSRVSAVPYPERVHAKGGDLSHRPVRPKPNESGRSGHDRPFDELILAGDDLHPLTGSQAREGGARSLSGTERIGLLAGERRCQSEGYNGEGETESAHIGPVGLGVPT